MPTSPPGLPTICRVFGQSEAARAELFQELLFQLRRPDSTTKAPAPSRAGWYRLALNSALGFQPRGQSATSAKPLLGLETSIAPLAGLEKALLVLQLDGLREDDIGAVLGLNGIEARRALANLNRRVPALSDAALLSQWREQPAKFASALPPAQLAQALKAKAARHDRASRRRGRVELLAALILILCFGVYFFVFRLPLARVGCGVVILSALSIVWAIRRAKRAPAEPPHSEPILAAFRRETQKIADQQKALISSLAWKVAPLMLGVNLFCFGLPRRGPYKLWFLASTLVLTAAAFWLNLRALRKKILAREGEVAALINSQA
jgi:hypothetical protein